MPKAVAAHSSTRFSALLTLTFFAALAVTQVQAASSGLVISQVYGGGGNSNAPFTNDFIEIFNRGNTPVSLSGLSLQYTSATGTGNLGASGLLTVLPNVTLQPGQYFLAQEAGGTTGVGLPTPDVIGPTNMSATGGKVALVNATTSLGCNGGSTPCNANQLALILDIVGYDGANFFEGAAAPTLSNTTAALRIAGGCTDTDNNSADFVAGAPQPRNTASPKNPCSQSLPPTGAGSASPASVAAGDSVLLMVKVTPGSNPTSTGLNVIADLSAIGGSTSQLFSDNGSNGDAVAGDNTFSFQTVVSPSTNAGAATLPLMISDDQGRPATGSIGLTVTRPPDQLNIHSIQGPGIKSPVEGHFVETSGVVTARKNNGFFVQNSDGDDDGDANTSEGLFVFTSSPPPATAAVGNLVRVRGTVAEFKPSSDPLSFSSTELSGSVQVTLISTSNPLPTPVTFTAADTVAGGSAQQLEKYQAMRVTVPSMTVVAPTQGSVDEVNATSTSNGVFFGVITGVARPFRKPGIQIPENLLFPPPPCCIPVFDGNSEHIRVDSDAQSGAAQIDVTTGAVITGLTGVLDYNAHEYTILPDPGTKTVSGNISAVPVPLPAKHEITVASMNMERFFDTTNDPSVDDVALTQTAFNNRLNKTSLIVRTILNLPDIIGVEEMENLPTLQAVAAKINSDAVASGLPDPQYVAYLVEGNDVGGIDVGFLVKSSRIAVSDVTQFGHDTTYVDPGPPPKPALLNDRPPLALNADVITSKKELPLSLTVIVNHLRSLNGIDDPTDGDRVRAKRLAQAHDLADLIQTFQVAGKNVVSIGDYNALSVNDGFVDVMGTILGTPAPADEDMLGDGTSSVSPALTDLLTTLPAEQQYSYSFDGDAQVLDHILVSNTIKPAVSRFAYARDDADFPEIYRNDPNRPERLSDHDQAIAYFTVPTDTTPPNLNLPGMIFAEATSAAGAVVTFSVSANDAIDGPTAVSCDHASGATYPLGTTVVSCSSTDAHDNTVAGSFSVKVQDTTPPVVSVTGVTNGASYTLGAVPAAGCTTTDSVSGVANFATVQITGGTANGTGTFTAGCSGGVDKAGNSAQPVSVNYNVGYLFSGFFAPLSPGVSGPFKAGSTVPLKWQLKSANTVVGSLSSIKSVQVAYNGDCAGSPDDTPFVADSPGNTGLRFEGGQFMFNWKTPAGVAPGCYSVLVGLDDNSTHSQVVLLK